MDINLLKKLVMIFFVLILSLTMLNKNVNADWSQMDSGTISDVYLYGVWGSSATNVFAVGDNDNTGTSIILQYDGSTWSQMGSGTLTDNRLRGVWGSSPTNVFAVGYNNNTDTSTILQYDGSTWSQMGSGTITDTSLYGVWGSSATDVFAVGYYYDGTTDTYPSIILHYDGSTWSQMASGSITDVELHGVWGSSATDVFAVGTDMDPGSLVIYYPQILHYDGSTWSQMNSGIKSYAAWLNGVWGSSATDVIAVGSYSASDLSFYSAIIHYDGSTWSGMDTGAVTDVDLYGVWGSSPTDVFAVGYYQDFTNDIYNSIILHYDSDSCSSLSIEPATAEVVSGQTLSFTIIPEGDCSDPNYEWSVESDIESAIDQNGNYTAGINSDFFNEVTDKVKVVDHGNSDISAEATVTVSWGCSLLQIYGENSKEVRALRSFRDNVLSKTPEGQELIRLYYHWSPVIVKAMEEDEKFKEEVKEVFDGILGLIEEETE